jgi:hypothetical protein
MTVAIKHPNPYTIKWKPKRWVIRFPRKQVTPELSKKFLRLNDRKQFWYHADFIKAGYPFVKTEGYNREEIREWCDEIIVNWCCTGDFYYFQNEHDAMLFKMRWL